MQALRQSQFFLYGMKNYIKRRQPFTKLQGNLQNKHIIITGASSGIGLGLARDFAKRKAYLHLVCRNKQKSQKIKDQLIKQSQNQNIVLHVCDIGQLRQIKKFVQQYKTNYGKLDILINNAGAMINTYQKTSQGYQKNFASNTLGTYYLTKLLIQVLQVPKSSKVIFVSSAGMLTQHLQINDYQMKKQKFDGTIQYAINKRHQVCIVQYFASIYTKKNIFFYSMHPGWVNTDGVKFGMPLFYKKFLKDLRSIQQGFDTIVYLSLTQDKKLKVGQFYFDRQIQGKHMFYSLTKYDQNRINKLIEDLQHYLAKYK